jgi:hypothetical protein
LALLRSFGASTSGAYLFLMVALLIGLPLLSGYYAVNPQFYSYALIPYLVISAMITIYIIRRSLGNPFPNGSSSPKSTFFAKFNSIPYYVLMALFTLLVVLFGAMRYLIFTNYPNPPPSNPTDLIGALYLVYLVAVSVLGFSRLIYSQFPILAKILAERKYALIAVGMFIGFGFVYLLLVNQILIQGLNTVDATVGANSSYPIAQIFTVGIQQPFLNLIYIPYVTSQLYSSVSLLIVPFEMVFTVLLSILVATNVVMAHYLISHSGLACSTKGAVLSTGGSIIGLTATCPTCLAPTLISVIFGGVVAAEAVYSNMYGVILPPVISLITLFVSVIYLSRRIKKNVVA